MKPIIRRMPRWTSGLWGLVLAAVAAACAAPTPAPEPTALPAPGPQPSAEWAREDRQGAVTVIVTPLNLERPTATLDFDVTLETHSVDLSMDLRELAILRTDTGREVQAVKWPVGSGHHYRATLSFPSVTRDGENLLEGASKLTLFLKAVDVPERVFEWDLSG